MPIDEAIIYRGDLGGAVFAYGGRRCIVIDENATEEEAQDTIKWARDVLESGKPSMTRELLGLLKPEGGRGQRVGSSIINPCQIDRKEHAQ